MKKKGLQISFAWLFAIIVGAFILFLAIYGVTKLIGFEQTTQDAKTGKEIGILLNPLETGFESVKATSLSFPVNTRIYNKCNTQGYFGRQIIQISQKSFNKWTETNFDVGFSNKYIFSEEYVEGKTNYVFTKPFEFPFKVTNLIYITSSLKKYCFLDAPKEIEDEVLSINQENLLTECEEEEVIRVCFDDESCDIIVDYLGGYVEKNGEKMYFETDALMYAAIFSEKDVYECQIKRLMQRIANLALIYKEKAERISLIGCDSYLEPDLLELINLANNLSSSSELSFMVSLVNDIKDKNEDGTCRLW